MGESAPHDNYDISHGICPSCTAKGAFTDDSGADRLSPLRSFFIELRELAVSGAAIDARTLISQARGLGVAPIDFLMGIFQPLLYEIGELWARGQVTVATEHRFSALTAAFIQLTDVDGPSSGECQPDVVLLSAQDNYHTLGLQIAHAFLQLSGVACEASYPALPLTEAVELLCRRRPRFVGFSVALLPQMQFVREVSQELRRNLDHAPRILVGGPIVRTGLRPHPSLGIEVVRDLRRLDFQLLDVRDTG